MQALARYKRLCLKIREFNRESLLDISASFIFPGDNRSFIHRDRKLHSDREISRKKFGKRTNERIYHVAA